MAYKVEAPPVIDGRLEETAWTEVGWSDDFVDISNNKPPRFQTQVKVRLDAEWLYIAATLSEPNVWANVTRHSQVIFNDNDFKVFIDADSSNHHYKVPE
ncbi:hypothetical protein WJX81_000850 [Elliptochloris bilobata]|uniref:Carbohydrate-binding domain-containing protein n=1 Tax=Elliptochloris bilobata TaxID=381761 RepID=A0AAW1RCQ7_9CHLO